MSSRFKVKEVVLKKLKLIPLKWPSGAYIALVKVTVAGKTSSKLVKMAVVK